MFNRIGTFGVSRQFRVGVFVVELGVFKTSTSEFRLAGAPVPQPHISSAAGFKLYRLCTYSRREHNRKFNFHRHVLCMSEFSAIDTYRESCDTCQNSCPLSSWVDNSSTPHSLSTYRVHGITVHRRSFSLPESKFRGGPTQQIERFLEGDEPFSSLPDNNFEPLVTLDCGHRGWIEKGSERPNSSCSNYTRKYGKMTE